MSTSPPSRPVSELRNRLRPFAPSIVVEVIGAVRRRAQAVQRLSGLASKARMIQMAFQSALQIESDRPPADTAVPLRVRDLDDKVVWLRPRSRDRAAFEFLFEEHHLPPAEATGPFDRIAVFGANIGLLLADLAARYPDAQLLGVEPDPDNAQLARRNLMGFGDRCRLVEKAVWHRDEQLTLNWERDAWGLDLANPSSGAQTGDVINAADAGTLLTDFAGDAPVDYLLVNIETAWYEMLRHGSWARNVRCIKIEIQERYDEAVPLLEGLGYRARLNRLNWGAFAIGVRP